MRRGKHMKKTLIFVVLLLSLFAYKVSAAPNTGPLPENGVKINFNENGTVNSVEGDGWVLDEQPEMLTLTKGEVVITLMHFEFKDDAEIVGFHWMVEGATAVLWVKHGTTAEVYGEGTEGEFTTSDLKGVSNAVFLIEIIVDEEEEEDDDEELDDEEENDDEEEEQNDEEEEIDEEEENDDDDEVLDEEEEQDDEEEEIDEEEDNDEDDEVLGDDDENVDEEEEEEDEVLGEDDEQLPDTSDVTSGLGLMSGLLGFVLLLASKKKD